MASALRAPRRVCVCVYWCMRAERVHVCASTGVGVPECVLGGLNIPPHLLRREGGIKDEGTEKSMAEWNPAVIELFQLTLTEKEEKKKTGLGGFQNIPSLAHSSFLTGFAALLLPLHSYLSAFVSFSISLYPEVARRLLFMNPLPAFPIFKTYLKM